MMRTLPEARQLLAGLPPLPATDQPLAQAVGAVLAEPVDAQLQLPHTSTSAMDGWALAAPDAPPSGNGPQWRVTQPPAGNPSTQLVPLQPGEAVGVVTGSPIPVGTVSVLRTEHSQLASGRLTASRDTPDLETGRNIRAAGIEAEPGDRLLDPGQTLTPVRAATAAVAGFDTVRVQPAPSTEIITTGTEIITVGLPAPGQVRDTFTLSLPAMIAALGGQTSGVWRTDDDVDAVAHRFAASSADLIVTTGGTAHSTADTLRPALRQSQADLLLDSVDMRPGHPVLAARLPSGAVVLGLPGNPLAGFAALTLLGRPLVAALRAEPDPLTAGVFTAAAGEDLPSARRGHRLLPVARSGSQVYATGFARPHMLRGLAQAEAFAMVPPDGVAAAEPVECHPVPGHPPSSEPPPG